MDLYRLGKVKEAAVALSHITDSELPESENARFLSAAALYVNGVAAGRSKEHVAQLVRLCAPAQTAEKVISAFSEKSRVLAALYPSCTSNCESCRTECLYPEIKRLFCLLYEMRRQHPVDQRRIAEMFRMTGE